MFIYLNCLGSSAGAGSGDFHVYRGVRRREYARQKFLDQEQKKVSKFYSGGAKLSKLEAEHLCVDNVSLWIYMACC